MPPTCGPGYIKDSFNGHTESQISQNQVRLESFANEDEGHTSIIQNNSLAFVSFDDLSSSSEEWFNNHYTPSIPVERFLQIAVKARGTANTCAFASRWLGGFNVAITIKFDDGVEWIVKTPKWVDDSAIARMQSEIATMKFLEKIGSRVTPRVHDFSVSTTNPVKTPYIIMDKSPGVTLNQALCRGLDRAGVYRTLEGLANFRKFLQRHSFAEIGSLGFDDNPDLDPLYCGNGICEENGYFVAELINMWSSTLPSARYCNSCWSDVSSYYFAQHTLGLLADGIYDDTDKIRKYVMHFYLGLLLQSYIRPCSSFYLAHTDLSVSNVLVDPSDGTLLGIIDWEFANTLPPQAVEHYPVFLADRQRFVKRFNDIFEDADAELNDWRQHYAKHFLDDPETSNFNSRIDSIFAFEYLLRHPNDRPLHKIIEAIEALKGSHSLTAPLPSLSWLDRLVTDPSSISTNGHTVASNNNPPAETTLESATPVTSADKINRVNTFFDTLPLQTGTSTQIASSSHSFVANNISPPSCSTNIQSFTHGNPAVPPESHSSISSDAEGGNHKSDDAPIQLIHTSHEIISPSMKPEQSVSKGDKGVKGQNHGSAGQGDNAKVGVGAPAVAKSKWYRPNLGGCLKIYRVYPWAGCSRGQINT